MKRFGVSRQSVALTAVSAVCVALLLPHGASSAVSRQSGDIQLVGKTKYLNNAHSAVTHTADDSTKHVVAVIDALDKYGVKGTLFISTSIARMDSRGAAPRFRATERGSPGEGGAAG